MPWSEPRGGGEAVGGLGSGIPVVSARQMTADGAGLTSAFDFSGSLFMPYDGGIVHKLNNVTPVRMLYQANAWARLTQYTNPATGMNNDPALFVNHVDGDGFILTSGGDALKTTTSDPATAVYTTLTDVGFAPTYTFSMANGNMYQRRNLNGILNVSSDGGVTWASSGNVINPGGSDDIDHCFISDDGSISAIGSPLGISFSRNPEDGSAGEISSLLTTAQVDGAFNANNNIFVWLTTTSSRGEIFYTTDFATVQTVPIATNPFQFDGATGYTVQGVVYVPQLEAFVFTGTGSFFAIMYESNMGVLLAGASSGKLNESSFLTTTRPAKDGIGNVTLCGNDMSAVTTLFYA